MTYNEHIEAGERTRRVYILLSRHYDLFSTFIYFVSLGGYTHVSVGLEDDPQTYYSFNSKGFRVEKPEEWRKRRVGMRQYEVMVTEEEYRFIKEWISSFKLKKTVLKYSKIGVALCIMKVPHKFRNKYFCSQFVTELLKRAGIIAGHRACSTYLPSNLNRKLKKTRFAHLRPVCAFK